MKQNNKKGEKGFSLIELIVVMGLLGIVLAITTGNFTMLLSALRGESKIAETEVEKIVGIEILRQDIENAGYGLPWFVEDPLTWSDLSDYTEAEPQTVCGTADITGFDDAPNNPPRAIISGDNRCSDGSDYLVIKSAVVRNHREAQKWTYIWNDGVSKQLNSWSMGSENIDNQTKVIVINPRQNVRDNVLITYVDGGTRRFYSQYSGSIGNYSLSPSEVYLLFGIGGDTKLRMPFNRADYFINYSNVPSRCANGTGVLTKATLDHDGSQGGKLSDYSPLIDCVADMQVVFGIDQTGTPDGVVDCYTNDLSVGLPANDALNVRNRTKEVRVYILAHEGQMDRGYRFGNSTIRVGDSSGLKGCDSSGVDRVLGRDFDLKKITNWQNYRWKVYTLVVTPDNLKGR